MKLPAAFLNKAFSSNRFRFLVLLLLTPGFWWVLLQPGAIISEVSRLPVHINSNLHSPSRVEYQQYLSDMRWGGQSVRRNNLISKVFYNKFGIVGKEIFDYLQFLTPRLYFLAGDGSNFSPPRVEPVSFLLFPFWIAGLVVQVKQSRWKPLVLTLALGLVAYGVGRKNMVFLFPVMLMYVYLASVGFSILPSRSWCKFCFSVIVLYGLYIVEMSLWLRPLSL